MGDNVNRFLSLASELGCEIKRDEALKDYTTFKIGGKCKAVVFPEDENSCAELLKALNEMNVLYTVIGNGSNILCSDDGFDGIVLKIGKSMEGLSLIDDTTVCVKAGTSLAKLCLFALDNSLTGLEFAYGIPGTVGGAVYMNAGAYGGEIKDVIASCKAVDINGNVKEYDNSQMELSYRHSIFEDKKNEIITSAVFKLKKGEYDEIQAKMNELMAKRKEKQPLEFPNAGSTFKRPEGQFAGKLIQDCGLRGFGVGDAAVSEKHCGFVINKGNATFEDVMSVIKKVQDEVLSKTGYFLECEIRILKSE